MGSKILQAKRVKCTPQDSINELIIWKINLLVVPVTNVKFKSELLHAKWAVNNLRELVCIWSDWKSLNELKFLEDIYIKFRETKLVEIRKSWSRNWIACEFTAHYACKNVEMNLKSTTANRLNFRIKKNLLINGILGGTLDLVCYTAVFSVVTQRSSPLTAAENRTTFLSCD